MVIRDFNLLRLNYWLNSRIKEETYRHILHTPLFHPERLSKGDYTYRQNSLTGSVSELVLTTTSKIIESILVILGLSIVMFAINVKLTLIVLGAAPILAILIRYYNPKIAVLGKETNKLTSKSSSIITESFNNSEVIQAYGLEEKQVRKLNNIWRESYKLNLNTAFISKQFTFFSGLATTISVALVGYFGGLMVIDKKLTVGALLIFTSYTGFLLAPIQEIVSQVTGRKQKLADSQMIHQVLDDHMGD